MCRHGGSPFGLPEIGRARHELSPLGEVGVGIVALAVFRYGEDVVDVGVDEARVLLAGRALSAAVAIGLIARAVDVLREGESERERANAFCPHEEHGVGDSALGRHCQETLLNGLLAYDVGESHGERWAR